jgi:23S rRNA (uracil1939-C5)-methyltransferase
LRKFAHSDFIRVNSRIFPFETGDWEAGIEEDIFTVKLDTLVYGGDAMGRLPDGRAVFVPHTLPGERVRVRLVEQKRGHARAELLEVLEASPDRIEPDSPGGAPCPGCHYQHMPYDLQLTAKNAILKEQLERIGGLVDPPLQAPIPSPQVWNYRNHIQLHVDARGQVGYHEARTNQVIPVQSDPLAEAPLNSILAQLDLEPIPTLERITLRLGMEEDILLILEANEPDPPELSVEDLDASVVYVSPNGQLLMAGSDHVYMQAAGRAFKVSAQSFFQVNTGQASQMVAYLLEHAALDEHTTVLELYSGVGLFSAFMAPRVGKLAAVEASESANADFVENLDEFENVELYEATVDRTLPGLEIQPDLILVDPPRSGLGPKVLPPLLALAAPHLIYISCDPATLARDAARLVEGGYQLEQITLFDMFPQTYHIESLSLWRR